MTEEKKLRRSTGDRMFAGVAGGLAEYFDVDPVWVRLAFAFLLVAGVGSSLIAYIILWIVMPEEPVVVGEPAA